MIIDLELGGRRLPIDVRRDGERWIVAIAGRTLLATVAEAGDRWSLLLSEHGEYWRSYEVSFETVDGAAYLVHVNGEVIPLAVVDPPARAKRRREAAGCGANGPVAIVAPMPGRIVKVLVRPGEAVAARQGVIVVEAMKMENELRAPRAGTVTDVRVTEGMSVEARAVLAMVE